MTTSSSTPRGARRSIRRAVQLACEIVTAHRDEPAGYLATDLSTGGLWLQTPEPVRAGEVVAVCFRPDGWRRQLIVFGEVARVATSRRRVSEPGSGMGVEFLDLAEAESARLEAWLRSRREPVPRRRRPLGPAAARPPSGPPPVRSPAVAPAPRGHSTPLPHRPRSVWR